VLSGAVLCCAALWCGVQSAMGVRSFYDTLEPGEEPPPPFVPFTRPAPGSLEEQNLKQYLKVKARAEGIIIVLVFVSFLFFMFYIFLNVFFLSFFFFSILLFFNTILLCD
jgi:hypothetical protein